MTQSRQPAGVPSGGQFTAASRAEPHLALVPDPVTTTAGPRYDGSDVAVIAKSMRSEIKTMQAAGDVPATWKTSVRIDRFSGGSSININVTGVDWETYDHPSYGDMQRPKAVDMLALGRIESALQAHNYDDSDSQVDYFDVHFYGHVSADGLMVGNGDTVCEKCVQYRPCGC